MKKLLTLLLALIILITPVVFLTGCSSKDEDDGEKTSKSSSKDNDDDDEEEEEDDDRGTSEEWKSSDFAKVGLNGAKELKNYKIKDYSANKTSIDIQYEADGGTKEDVIDFCEELFALTENYSGEFTETYKIELKDKLDTLEDATFFSFDSYVSYWWYYKHEDDIYQVIISGDPEVATVSIVNAGH